MFEKLVEEYHKLVGSDVQNPVVYRSTPMDDSQVTPVTDASVEAPAPSDPTTAALVEAPIASAPVNPPAAVKFEDFKNEFVSFEDKIVAYRKSISDKEAAIAAMYEEILTLLDSKIAELTQFKAEHLS